jgi:hypothetical protein
VRSGALVSAYDGFPLGTSAWVVEDSLTDLIEMDSFRFYLYLSYATCFDRSSLNPLLPCPSTYRRSLESVSSLKFTATDIASPSGINSSGGSIDVVFFVSRIVKVAMHLPLIVYPTLSLLRERAC